MSNHLLLKLLQAGLLTELGDDDQRRERAEAAAQGVSEWLKGEARTKLAAALCRSIDEASAPADDPVLKYADERLLEVWPSARNAFPEPPNELLKAIVFQASVTAATSDEDLEAATWYILRTVKALELSVGRWEPVVRDETSRIDAAVSDRLDLTWLPSADIDHLRMPPTRSRDTIKVPKRQSKALDKALQPYKSNLSGNYPNVSEALGTHVPPALAEIETAIADLVNDMSDGGELRAFSKKLGDAIREQFKAQWAVVKASRLRENLLWWRLAAYSDVLGERYADVGDPALCAIAAAHDIRRLAPRVAPVAVEHLLGAAMASDVGTERSITFSDLMTAWERIESTPDFSVDDYGIVISAIAASDADVSVLALPETLTPADAAKLVFRDLQVVGLLDAHAVDAPESAS